MSELARNEYGDEWTAFDLKDEFLRHGTKFRWFVCAFCDTPVSPAAVYGKDFVKAPYFTLAEKGNYHTSICPYGTAGLSAHGIARPAPAKAHEFEVDLPERLVPMRASKPAIGTHANKPSDKATDADVRARVRTRASTLMANQYTTSLLQTVVTARAVVMRDLFKKASADGIQKEKQAAFVFSEMKKYPLNLYGKRLDYNSAFHNTHHIPWDGQFVYHGDAKVRSVPDGFELTSALSIKPEDSVSELPVHIIVLCDRAAPAKKMESRTIDTLARHEALGESVRWFAYGSLKLNEAKSSYELIVREPGHFYAAKTKPSSRARAATV